MSCASYRVTSLPISLIQSLRRATSSFRKRGPLPEWENQAVEKKYAYQAGMVTHLDCLHNLDVFRDRDLCVLRVMTPAQSTDSEALHGFWLIFRCGDGLVDVECYQHDHDHRNDRRELCRCYIRH